MESMTNQPFMMILEDLLIFLKSQSRIQDIQKPVKSWEISCKGNFLILKITRFLKWILGTWSKFPHIDLKLVIIHV